MMSNQQQPAFAQNEYRSINEEFLFLIGICTQPWVVRPNISLSLVKLEWVRVG